MKKIVIGFMVLMVCSTMLMPTDPPIKYEVLRSWHPAHPSKPAIGMDVLVSPTATKNEVMSLAKYFVNEHRSEGFIVIFIFNLKEAWENRDNENYSQKKYFHHFLVSIFVPANSGQNEITWEMR